MTSALADARSTAQVPPATTAPRPSDATERTEDRPARVYYFDYLRVLATLGVVLIHSATQVFNVTRALPGTDLVSHYTASDASEALGRFAVGCFFMVSGALLLDSRHRLHLPRQLVRVAVPMLVWSCVYLTANAWWTYRGLPTTSGSTDQTSSVTNVLKTLLAGSASNHFWFVYALIACYLALPLLRPVTALPEARQKRLLEYALAIWVVTFLVVPTVNHYAPGAIAPYPDLLPSLPSKYLGFVLLGYYLHRFGVRIRGWQPGRGTLVAVAAGAVVAITAMTLWDQLHRSGSGWAQTNPTLQVVVYGAAVFLLAKQLLDRPGRHFAFVALVSRLSFRIYLVHMLVLFWLRSISPLKDLYTVQPELSIVVLGSITLAVSFAVAWGVDRLPRLRRWV